MNIWTVVFTGFIFIAGAVIGWCASENEHRFSRNDADEVREALSKVREEVLILSTSLSNVYADLSDQIRNMKD